MLTFAIAATAAPPVPVKVGDQPGMDACTSLAVVTSRRPLALRTGPGQRHAKVITLKPGDLVHLCGTSSDAQWSAVVLAQDGILDCRVSSPAPAPGAYEGPCVSGWLPAKWLEPVAG
ncbi:hypothetical protein [Agrilutibacter solisilvae]|uniref:SH3 domain-containing protein n=1 Tax=Agrilutibacter solisilvae TaxID=2763317 RepID=A0A974Y196_9GAMM|nr:hypothetical protein [Lysobacter solisilvae]QSX79572.1 hypothetical protein I8J32_006900 [Lysobacter solisilvae]